MAYLLSIQSPVLSKYLGSNMTKVDSTETHNIVISMYFFAQRLDQHGESFCL